MKVLPISVIINILSASLKKTDTNILVLSLGHGHGHGHGHGKFISWISITVNNKMLNYLEIYI